MSISDSIYPPGYALRSGEVDDQDSFFVEEGFLAPMLGAKELSFGQYALVMTAFAVVASSAVFFARAMDMVWVGLVVAGGLLALLTLVRVEFGLFVLAALIPFEWHTLLGEGFSVPKAVGLVVGVVGGFRLLMQRRVPWPAMMKILAVLAGWLLLCALLNLDRGRAMRGLATRLMLFVMVYLLFRYCWSPQALKALMFCVVVATMVAGAWGIVLGRQALEMGIIRAREDLHVEDVNTFASLMFPGIFLSFALLWEVRGKLARTVLLVGAVVCLAALLSVISRSGALGAAVGLAVAVLTLRRIPMGKRIGMVVAVAVLIGAGFLFVALGGFGEAWKERMTGSGGIGKGVQHRLAVWGAGVKVWSDNPVFGVGAGNESIGFYESGVMHIHIISHNDYIASFVEGGVIGGVLYLIFCGYWVVSVWRLPSGGVRSGLLGLTLALLLAGFFNPGLWKKFLWMPVGISMCAVALNAQRQRQAAEHPSETSTEFAVH